MDYETAIESEVSVKAAIRELEKHDVFGVDYDETELFLCTTGEVIATVNGGFVSGADVLAWLGY